MIGRIARPYAQATFAAAGSTANAQRVLGELRALGEVLQSSPELRRAAVNPGLPLETKLRIIDTVGAKIGSSDITRRLAALLVRNYRLERLGEIADGLEIKVRQALGTVLAEVTSATPLTSEQHQALVRSLSAVAGRSVELTATTDPSLLAGFVARIGSTVYDASLKRRLERLSARLASA